MNLKPSTKLRQLTFSGEIISEGITAQVHWIQKADGRKNHTIKLDVKSMKAYDRWYDCWYSYQGEDDIYDEDFEDPRWLIEEICEVKIADHGGNEFLDEKMYGGYSFEEDYFGLLVQISDRRRYGDKKRLALVCREDFEPIAKENQNG